MVVPEIDICQDLISYLEKFYFSSLQIKELQKKEKQNKTKRDHRWKSLLADCQEREEKEPGSNIISMSNCCLK